VVLDTLYTSHASVGIFKAKALAIAGRYCRRAQVHLRREHHDLPPVEGHGSQALLAPLRAIWMPGTTRWSRRAFSPCPGLAQVDIRQLGLSPTWNLAMFGAGGLMGIRAASSMMLGLVLNFCVIVPWMISAGEIHPRADGTFSRIHVLNTWALWWGIAIMVVAALTSLFAKPQVLVSAFSGFFKKSAPGRDVVGHIELPLRVSFIGIPIIGVLGVFMINRWFGVRWDLGLLALPLIFVLASSPPIPPPSPASPHRIPVQDPPVPVRKPRSQAFLRPTS